MVEVSCPHCNGRFPIEDDESDYDDERPESMDDKVSTKEMRRGIDLATTVERIEMDFAITNPRSENTIVRFQTLNSLVVNY
ncbi:hypothetical protein GIB67_032024 [Kingdonia uniflora]|uniref:Uncharacterized protein n=1 Tax=Kingdonia uniflora TaxID=39325 RepID=A0A7J7MWJ6_9MAGN|nr:hypothetical protein GIB67_032024 [Kingdonia uniflora]